MPTEEDDVGLGEKVSIKDPYSGLHPESVFAIWHDPTTYDLMKHGPPYLPDQQIKVGSTQDVKQIKNVVRPLVEKTAADSMTTLLVIVQHIKSEFGDAPLADLAVLLSFMRAELVIHQASHWQSRGESFYGDHLLFMRIYEDLLEEIDKVAERAVGTGGPVLVHPMVHAKSVSGIVQSFYEGAPVVPNADELALISLRAVLHTLVVQKIVYGRLEQSGLLSHGMDNLIQGVADKHEEFVYLLKARTTQKTASYNRQKVGPNDPRWKSR